jgi:hypothetical protein
MQHLRDLTGMRGERRGYAFAAVEIRNGGRNRRRINLSEIVVRSQLARLLAVIYRVRKSRAHKERS